MSEQCRIYEDYVCSVTLLDLYVRKGFFWRSEAWSRGERFSHLPPCFALVILSSFLPLRPTPNLLFLIPVLAESAARKASGRLAARSASSHPRECHLLTKAFLVLPPTSSSLCSCSRTYFSVYFPPSTQSLSIITCFWICSFVFPHENPGQWLCGFLLDPVPGM